MKNVKLSLAFWAITLMSILTPNLVSGQTQTPVLESIDLPFNIDGRVERSSSMYGDWTKGAQTNGIDSGSIFFDNGDIRPLPLTYHTVDLYNTGGSGSDDVFDGGNKYAANPTTWGWKYGGTQGKSEINNVNIHFSNDTTNGDLWAIMAGDRYSTTGTAYLDFEFYQNAITPVAPSGGSNGSFTTNGTACGRTVGDLLVTVEYSGGGSVDSLYFYKWEASASASCGYDWVPFTIPASNAFGFANNTTVGVPYKGFGATTYTTKQFVEIAVNISSLVDGSIGSNPCTGLYFESVFVKTKSSTTSTADLKDMVMPIQLNLNLGKADIEYPTPVCAGGGVYNPVNNGPSSTDGGTYAIDPTSNGISINSTTGAITVGSTAVGTYNVYYTYSPRTGCTQYDTFQFTVEHHISGNVFNDVDGLEDNTVDGSGVDTVDGVGLFAVLVNNSDEVVESVPVANDGSFEFGCGPNGTYSVILKTNAPADGSTGNTSNLPTGWEFTGEILGTGTGSDGSPDGELSGISVSSADVMNANFGINKRPEAVSYIQAISKPNDGEELRIGIDTRSWNRSKSILFPKLTRKRL